VARREVVEVKNVPKHGDNPIPVCTRLGNLILPSVISGRAPDQTEQSADPETQIAQAFTNMKKHYRSRRRQNGKHRQGHGVLVRHQISKLGE